MKQRLAQTREATRFIYQSHEKQFHQLKAHQDLKNLGNGRINLMYKGKTPHLRDPDIQQLLVKYPVHGHSKDDDKTKQEGSPSNENRIEF